MAQVPPENRFNDMMSTPGAHGKWFYPSFLWHYVCENLSVSERQKEYPVAKYDEVDIFRDLSAWTFLNFLTEFKLAELKIVCTW